METVWTNLGGLTTYFFGIVGEVATLIVENPLLQVVCIGIPTIGIAMGYFSSLLQKRI